MKNVGLGMFIIGLTLLLIGSIVDRSYEYGIKKGIDATKKEAIKVGAARYVADKETGDPVFEWVINNQKD